MTAYDVAKQLPGASELREHCRGLAMAEAILSPEWENRYYSFNNTWAPNVQLASMRDGCGDEYAAVFSVQGVYLRGFAHETPVSPYVNDGMIWPGVCDTLPDAFRPFLEEPAFRDENGTPLLTCCLWRRPDDESWRTGLIDYPVADLDPDGADDLFMLLTDRSPQCYVEFAEDYYETPVDVVAVQELLTGQPLTQALVTALNPEVSLKDLAADIAEIGYRC